MQQTVEALRARLAQHNRRALVLAAASLVGSALLWSIAYFVLYWVTLLSLTAARGIEAQPPKAFAAIFLYAAALLLGCAIWLRRTAPDERPPDERRAIAYLADFALALPRATLAVWGNVSAWQRLTQHELEAAAHLVELMHQDGRFPLHRLPLEIPERAERKNVLLALQILELIEIRRIEGELWLMPAAAAQNHFLGS